MNFNRFKRFRFGTRTLLVLFALVAVGIVTYEPTMRMFRARRDDDLCTRFQRCERDYVECEYRTSWVRKITAFTIEVYDYRTRESFKKTFRITPTRRMIFRFYGTQAAKDSDATRGDILGIALSEIAPVEVAALVKHRPLGPLWEHSMFAIGLPMSIYRVFEKQNDPYGLTIEHESIEE